MIIQASPALYTAAALAPPASARPDRPPTTADTAARVHISQTAHKLLAAEQAGQDTAGQLRLDTSRGTMTLDIDAYFSPSAAGGFDLAATPLLLPTQHNIDTLAAHVSARMPGFLAAHGIPQAPAQLSYDHLGKLQLPADYPHAEAFTRALDDDPQLARQLRTVAALSSHADAIGESLAFQAEYRAASSAAGIAAVVAKYAHLFSNQRSAPPPALAFAADGSLSPFQHPQAHLNSP